MFTLAACAEMLFRDLPIEARVRRIAELGFEVEIWDWTRHDIGALERTGASFSSMTGYVTGDLIDPDGADELLCTAARSIPVAKRLEKQGFSVMCPALAGHCSSSASLRKSRWRRCNGLSLMACSRSGLGDGSGIGCSETSERELVVTCYLCKSGSLCARRSPF